MYSLNFDVVKDERSQNRATEFAESIECKTIKELENENRYLPASVKTNKVVRYKIPKEGILTIIVK